VLAVDISYSMDPEELALQREGYVKALTSPSFSTPCASASTVVAVTYFEWAGRRQRVVVPWRVVDGPEARARWRTGYAAPIGRAAATSISGALLWGGCSKQAASAASAG
jgi:hypothetical protein